MSPSKIRSRLGAAAASLAAAAAAVAVLASPAAAAGGSGSAFIVPAVHEKGRTLSGQGVKILAGSGASTDGGKLGLPIDGIETGPGAWASSGASLRFSHGSDAVALSGIRFEV